MSITARTTYTMHCARGRPEPCTATVTSEVSEKDLREQASAMGWHVDWGILRSGGYDACPRHIEMLDRVDWSSCA